MSKDEAEAVARRMKDEEVLTGRVNPKAYKRQESLPLAHLNLHSIPIFPGSSRPWATSAP